MKILVTRFPLESAEGGAEVQTISLMEKLQKRGHAVAFLGSCPVLLRWCEDRGIPFQELDIGPPPVTKFGVVSFVWRRFGMRRKLRDALQGFPRLDAMIMISLSEKLLLSKTALKRKIRVIWLEHDPLGRWLTKNPWIRTLVRLSRSVTTVTVSELQRTMYKKLGWRNDALVAIPNGVDEKRFAHVKPRRTKSHRIHLGCVARLYHGKGIDLLIQAVHSLPEVTLTILGKGPEEEHLRILARSKGYGDRIDIQTDAHLDEVYGSIDALVLPSRNEPFGMVAAEAMLIGVPVIVTDACGIASFLKDGRDGRVVPAKNTEALRSAVVTMMDPQKRAVWGDNGKKVALKHFTVDRMVDAYENLLRATRKKPTKKSTGKRGKR